MGKGGGTFDRLLGTLIQHLLTEMGLLANDESRYDVSQRIVLKDVVGLWLSGQLANFLLVTILLWLRGLN